MLFFNSLIWNNLVAQPVFHLAGEAVYKENLVKESNLMKEKAKEKVLVKKCNSENLQRVKQGQKPGQINYAAAVKLNKLNNVKSNLYKNGI